MKTHKNILDKLDWKTLPAEIGVDYTLIHSWYYRNKIPSDHWPKILKAAKKRKIQLTLQKLMDTSKVTKR